MKNEPSVYSDYFRNRNIDPSLYSKFKLPAYMKKVLPENRSSAILDIGCGFGQMLNSFRQAGFEDLCGVDISDEAVEFCLGQKIKAIQIKDLRAFCRESAKKYDFIIMSHMLEHLEKSSIIDSLIAIKRHLMNPRASLLVMVPNAQSNTGCYWAYEDFTHQTIFTAGSLFFVLKAAGFESIEFLDPDGLEGTHPLIIPIKKMLLAVYKANKRFWNIVTTSSFHRPSPQIFTYELKTLAK